LLVGGFLILVNFNNNNINIEETKAGSSDNVYGWAWSDNIGWISFNCYNDYNGINGMGDAMEDRCAGNDYGVNIDSITGVLSGYAWSDNIGWISFKQADLAGCPSGFCIAQVDLSSGEVSGWAKVLNSTGTDYGWISLKDAVNGYNGVVIDMTIGHFSNYAWGGGPTEEAVIGWINFTGTDYYVWTDPDIFNTPPEVDNLVFSKSDCCDQSVQDLPVTFYFQWDYSDPDGDPQFSYELQVDYQTGDFSSPVITKYIETDSPNSTLLLKTIPIAGQDLAYNTPYKTRVIVWDDLEGSQGASSVPSNVVFLNVPTDIPVNRYPKPDFSWDPSKPKIGDEIQFTNESILYSVSPTGTYLWDFDGEGISTDTNPKFTFSSIGDKRVTLQVTDAVGNICSNWRDIRIRPGEPGYNEVIPR